LLDSNTMFPAHTIQCV